jgi:hypothetical protein
MPPNGPECQPGGQSGGIRHRDRSASQGRSDPDLPAMTAPVMAVPAMAAPAPVTPVPVTPVPVVSPTDLFGLEVIDIVLRRDRGFCGFAAPRLEALFRCNRRQRRGLRARSNCCSARGKSKGEFQKVTAFHDFSSFAVVADESGSFAASR